MHKFSKHATALLVGTMMSASILAAGNTFVTVNGTAVSQNFADIFIAEQKSQGAPDSPEMKNAVREELIRRELLLQGALIALAGFAVFAWVRRMPIRGLLLAATLAFLAALFFRSIDIRVCAAFPVGTHFLWHLMNGLMVGLILMALLATDPRER